MSGGGGEAWYAVSLISYAVFCLKKKIIKFADLLIELSGRLFAARPHWGKNTPLPPPDVKRLFPEYERFLEIRDALDPTGAFRHRWVPAESLLAISRKKTGVALELTSKLLNFVRGSDGTSRTPGWPTVRR